MSSRLGGPAARRGSRRRGWLLGARVPRQARGPGQLAADEVVDVELRMVGALHDQALGDAEELADVPGPGRRRQPGHRSRGNPRRPIRIVVQAGRRSGLRQALPERTEEQDARVGAARAQGRDVDRIDVQAKIEGVVERLLAHLLLEILVGGGDDADVDRPRLVGSHRQDGVLLQRAKELGLDLRRGLSNLVQEQRSAVGLHESARPAALRIGEGAARVPEEVGVSERAGQARHVQNDERAARACALGVDRAGRRLLAHAGLAPDQDRRARMSRGAEDFSPHLLDLVAGAEEAEIARAGHRKVHAVQTQDDPLVDRDDDARGELLLGDRPRLIERLESRAPADGWCRRHAVRSRRPGAE